MTVTVPAHDEKLQLMRGDGTATTVPGPGRPGEAR
jgi:hypothetical protein